MAQNNGSWRLSLKELFLYWIVWLGVLLWASSLCLPAATKGEESYRGIELLIGSIVVTGSRPALLGKVVVLFSVVAFLLQLLMLIGLVLWCRKSEYFVFMRGIAILLVLGAVVFKVAEHTLFDATDIGFQVWMSSFVCVGIGLFASSIVSRRKGVYSEER